MKTWQMILRFMSRFRHHVSLPEDVSSALGIQFSNFISVSQLLRELASPRCHPTRLQRYMKRCEAEKAFQRAVRIERFSRHTLCSYYFKDGWLEFVLQFDEQGHLRRLYIHHKDLDRDEGLELPLRVVSPGCVPSSGGQRQTGMV